MFERSFLDLDATREHVDAELAARLLEVDAERERADREAAEKVAAAHRLEADYLAGKLSAESYERFGPRVATELAAAEAEGVRLTANAASLRASRAELDAEGTAFRRLGALRSALLERKRTAEQESDAAALRAALHQTFTSVVLMTDGHIFVCEPRLERTDRPSSGTFREVFGTPVGFAPRPETTQQGTFVWKNITQKTLRPE